MRRLFFRARNLSQRSTLEWMKHMLKTKTNSTRLRCTTRRHDFTRLGERKKVETSIKANFMPHHRHTPTHNNTKHNTPHTKHTEHTTHHTHDTHNARQNTTHTNTTTQQHKAQHTQHTRILHTQSTQKTQKNTRRTHTENTRTRARPTNQGSANGSLRSGQPRRLPTSCHSAKRAVVLLCLPNGPKQGAESTRVTEGIHRGNPFEPTPLVHDTVARAAWRSTRCMSAVRAHACARSWPCMAGEPPTNTTP